MFKKLRVILGFLSLLISTTPSLVATAATLGTDIGTAKQMSGASYELIPPTPGDGNNHRTFEIVSEPAETIDREGAIALLKNAIDKNEPIAPNHAQELLEYINSQAP